MSYRAKELVHWSCSGELSEDLLSLNSYLAIIAISTPTALTDLRGGCQLKRLIACR